LLRHGDPRRSETPSQRRDGWGQAIQFAMSLAGTILDLHSRKGWKMLWPDTREEVTVKEMFGERSASD